MNWLLSKLEAITYGAEVFSVIRLTILRQASWVPFRSYRRISRSSATTSMRVRA